MEGERIMNAVSAIPATVAAEVSGAGSFFGSCQIMANNFGDLDFTAMLQNMQLSQLPVSVTSSNAPSLLPIFARSGNANSEADNDDSELMQQLKLILGDVDAKVFERIVNLLENGSLSVQKDMDNLDREDFLAFGKTLLEKLDLIIKQVASAPQNISATQDFNVSALQSFLNDLLKTGLIIPQESAVHQEPSFPQEPIAQQQPSSPQEPIAQQQPSSPQEPIAQQQPAAPQKPIAQQQPAAPQKPIAQQQPAAPQKPIASREPTSPQEPIAQQQPAAPQKPITLQEPTSSQELAAPQEATAPQEIKSSLKNLENFPLLEFLKELEKETKEFVLKLENVANLQDAKIEGPQELKKIDVAEMEAEPEIKTELEPFTLQDSKEALKVSANDESNLRPLNIINPESIEREPAKIKPISIKSATVKDGLENEEKAVPFAKFKEFASAKNTKDTSDSTSSMGIEKTEAKAVKAEPEVRAVWEGSELKIEIINPKTGEKLQSVPTNGNMLRMQERINEFEVVRQVITQAKFTTTPTGEQRMTMQLKPEHLGQLELRIILNHGEMQINARVENAAVQHALENQIGMLREGLEKQGIVLERLEISVEQRENRDAYALMHEHENHKNGQDGKHRRKQHAHLTVSMANKENADTGRRLGYNTMEYLA
jgi:flagellar hook-length control protein FliK